MKYRSVRLNQLRQHTDVIHALILLSKKYPNEGYVLLSKRIDELGFGYTRGQVETFLKNIKNGNYEEILKEILEKKGE